MGTSSMLLNMCLAQKGYHVITLKLLCHHYKSKLQSNYSSQKESQSLLQKGANPARHSQKKM